MAKVMRITETGPSAFSFEADRYPDHPGCYLMRNAAGNVIYVGKAKSLRRRLRAYFTQTAIAERKREMIERIRDIEVILARNEREALVLESQLIRRHDPSYNSRFTRDDDSYYYIARTDEGFARLVPYRKRRTNYALGTTTKADALFGPYVGWRLRNRILDAVRTQFPLRTCHRLPTTPCVRRSSGACAAPCSGGITADAYRKIVSAASRFLRRPPRSVLRSLREQMESAASDQAFERAGELRDRLSALEHAATPQVAERHKDVDLDVLHVDAESVLRMSVRDGAIVDVGPLVCRVDATEDLLGALGDGLAERLIANRSLGIPDGDATRLRVPVSHRSYAGQLLEVCRINHAYRLVLSETAGST